MNIIWLSFPAFVESLTNPRCDASEGEYDVQHYQKDEPVIKVLQLNEAREASHDDVSGELGKENERWRTALSFLFSGEPTPQRPEQKAASVGDEGHRPEEDVCHNQETETAEAVEDRRIGCAPG